HDRVRGGAAGAAELHVLRAAALRVRHPLCLRHRHGGWRGDRLLPLGHDPLLQRSRSGHGDPAHRGHGDAHRRRLRPHPAGGHLRAVVPGGGWMRAYRSVLLAALAMVTALAGTTFANDPTWPKEITFALLSTESAPEIVRRWGPMLAQLE